MRSHANRDTLIAGWSSPVARQAHNLKVVGSNPTPATKPTKPSPTGGPTQIVLIGCKAEQVSDVRRDFCRQAAVRLAQTITLAGAEPRKRDWGR